MPFVVPAPPPNKVTAQYQAVIAFENRAFIVDESSGKGMRSDQENTE